LHKIRDIRFLQRVPPAQCHAWIDAHVVKRDAVQRPVWHVGSQRRENRSAICVARPACVGVGDVVGADPIDGLDGEKADG
jgi:hypothetical protein